MTGTIFLNYQRKQYSEQAVQSLDVCITELHVVERLGISAAINEGLKYWFKDNGADAVFVCSNDIEMPKDYRYKALEALTHIPETGLIAFHCVESLPPKQYINGLPVHPAWGVFGNYLLTRQAFEAVGYWNTDHDPYGMNDSDYCYRVHKAGFLNYYLADVQAKHLGHDVGEKSEYRQMKDEGLNKAGAIFNKWQQIYDKGNLYLPYEQEDYIIEMNQMEG